MIVANVRCRLKRDDAQLAIRLIARESRAEQERAEATLRDRGLDALLDDPQLLPSLLEARHGACASYPLLSYVLVRQALRSLGEEDRLLADYVAAILLEFGLRGRATRISASDDECYTTLAELAAATHGPDGQRTFLVRAHMGNYALWLSGLFPDYIAGRHSRRGAPDLDYYEDLGRHAFALAAKHGLANQHGLSDLFAQAADRFVILRMALNRISDTYLFPNVNSPDRLLRQVSNQMRTLAS